MIINNIIVLAASFHQSKMCETLRLCINKTDQTVPGKFKSVQFNYDTRLLNYIKNDKEYHCFQNNSFSKEYHLY
jgi:hypothetical protein